MLLPFTSALHSNNYEYKGRDSEELPVSGFIVADTADRPTSQFIRILCLPPHSPPYPYISGPSAYRTRILPSIPSLPSLYHLPPSSTHLDFFKVPFAIKAKKTSLITPHSAPTAPTTNFSTRSMASSASIDSVLESNSLQTESFAQTQLQADTLLPPTLSTSFSDQPSTGVHPAVALIMTPSTSTEAPPSVTSNPSSESASFNAGEVPPLEKTAVDLIVIDEAKPEDLSSPHTASEADRTAFTFVIAAAEAKEGIHYTLEQYPMEGQTYFAAPFSKEPIKVVDNERVVILEEVNDYAVRVRKVSTGEVGVIPTWNTEGALERLARLNMIFNEAATCPAEIEASHSPERPLHIHNHRSQSSESHSHSPVSPPHSHAILDSLAHIHAKCQPPKERVPLTARRYTSFAVTSLSPEIPAVTSSQSPASSDSEKDDESSSDDAADDAPRTPIQSPSDFPSSLRQKFHEFRHRRSKKSKQAVIVTTAPVRVSRKSVVFATNEKPPVFRYIPPERLLPQKEESWSYDSSDEEDQNVADEVPSDASESDEEGKQWWWAGWEETQPEPSATLVGFPQSGDDGVIGVDAGFAGNSRMGRPRFRRSRALFTTGG